MTRITIPPAKIVKTLSQRPEMSRSTYVLDVGCHDGRNSFYLVERGHTVTGIDTDAKAIERACDIAGRDLGRLALTFLPTDLKGSGLMPASFGALICNEVIHQVPLGHGRQKLLTDMKAMVLPGGLHAVSDYIYRPDTHADISNDRFLQPQQLLQSYTEAGWDILHYDETEAPLTYSPSGRPHVNSSAQLIARKPE